MKYFLTLALFACSLVGYTQVSASFNPDYNGDGYVGVDDILGVLSHYDTPWEAGAAENIVIDSLTQVIQSLQDQIDQMNEVCVIYGCTDIEACNYDVAANTDDGSCASLDMCGICGGGNDCVGCMDPNASLYDEGATIEGPCAYSVYMTKVYGGVTLINQGDGPNYQVSFDVGWTGKLDIQAGCYFVDVALGNPWDIGAVLINDELYTGETSFCVEPEDYFSYPCSTPNLSALDEGFMDDISSGFGVQWEIANSSLPNVYDSCTVVRWQQPAQLDCYIQGSEVNCTSPSPNLGIFPLERLANISTTISSWVAEHGLEAPSQECVFQLGNEFNRGSQQSCGSWTQTEDIGGIGGTASVTAPSNSGALLVRCGGIDKTFNVTVPSSYSHAFLQGGELGHVGGIRCVFNITYNPLTTVLVGTPSGIDVNYTFTEDTDL